VRVMSASRLILPPVYCLTCGDGRDRFGDPGYKATIASIRSLWFFAKIPSKGYFGSQVKPVIPAAHAVRGVTFSGY